MKTGKKESGNSYQMLSEIILVKCLVNISKKKIYIYSSKYLIIITKCWLYYYIGSTKLNI